MIHDIEDNYSEYLTDTLGYQWDAWDRLTQQEIAEHDQILAGRDPKDFSLQDLGTWAYCRRMFLERDFEAFIESGRTLFEEKKVKSDVLSYPEIAAFLSTTMTKIGLFGLVEIFLKARLNDYPDNVELQIANFILKAARDEGFEDELRAIKDPELLFDITEGFLEAGFTDAARLAFNCCADEVGNQPLSAIHVDLASMQRKLAQL